MGANQWGHCIECSIEGREVTEHPMIALYARPPGKKSMVRVGWLLRCGHVKIETNPAEAIK